MKQSALMAAFFSTVTHLFIIFFLFYSFKTPPPQEVSFTINFQSIPPTPKQIKPEQKLNALKDKNNPVVNQKLLSSTTKKSTHKQSIASNVNQTALNQTPDKPNQNIKKIRSPKTPIPIAFSSISKGIKLVAPHYPEAALRFGLEASIHLRLTINPNGRVSKIDFLGQPLPEKLFIQSIKEAIIQWEFPKTAQRTIRVTEKRINFIAGEVQ